MRIELSSTLKISSVSKALIARLLGFIFIIAPAYGYAQICEAEIKEIERVKSLGGLGSLVGNHYPFVQPYYPLDKPGANVRQIVNSEIEWMEKHHCSRINFSGSRANLEEQILKKEDMLKQWKRNESEAIKRWAGDEKGYHQAVLSEYAVLAYWKYTLCVWDTHNTAIKCDPTSTHAQGKILTPTKSAPTTAASSVKATGSSYTPGNLTPQQITACSEEIKAKQIESQSWPGNVNDISAKLGRFQKDLFEGRCKGHPEAQAYIAGANKMLSYGGNPNGGTSNSNVAGNVPTGPAEATLQNRPNQQLPSSSNFIRDDGFYERGHGEYRDGILVFNPNPSLLANECMVKFKDIHTGKNGTWRLKNGCNYPVAVASCHNGPHPTNKTYNCQLRTDMGVGVTQPNEIHPVVVERHPHWVACKAPGLPITKWDEGKRKLMGTCTVKSNPDSQWKTFYTH